jgi:hypothetical protein
MATDTKLPEVSRKILDKLHEIQEYFGKCLKFAAGDKDFMNIYTDVTKGIINITASIRATPITDEDMGRSMLTPFEQMHTLIKSQFGKLVDSETASDSDSDSDDTLDAVREMSEVLFNRGGISGLPEGVSDPELQVTHDKIQTLKKEYRQLSTARTAIKSIYDNAKSAKHVSKTENITADKTDLTAIIKKCRDKRKQILDAQSEHSKLLVKKLT